MEELIVIPIVIVALMGTLAQLEDLSLQTQERTVAFADDAVKALDCAYEARPLLDCAPNLYSHDFHDEQKQLIEISESILDDVQEETRVEAKPTLLIQVAQ